MSADHAQSTPVTMAVVPAEVGDAMLRGRTKAGATVGIVVAASATAGADAVAMGTCVETTAEATAGTDAEVDDAEVDTVEDGRWPEPRTSVAASAAEAAAETDKTGIGAAAVF